LEKEPVEEARDEIDVTEETVDARLRLDVASVALPVEDVLEWGIVLDSEDERFSVLDWWRDAWCKWK